MSKKGPFVVFCLELERQDDADKLIENTNKATAYKYQEADYKKFMSVMNTNNKYTTVVNIWNDSVVTIWGKRKTDLAPNVLKFTDKVFKKCVISASIIGLRGKLKGGENGNNATCAI